MKQAQIPITQITLSRIAAFDQLPDQALLSVSEVSALAGRSIPSIWRDVQKEYLAAPIKLGARSARWRVSSVRSYLNGERA